MTLKELREARAAAWQHMQDLDKRAEAEKRSMSAEESAQWDKHEADIQRFSAEITSLEREEARSATRAQHAASFGGDVARPQGDGQPREAESDDEKRYQAAFTHYLRWGTRGMKTEQVELMQRNFSQAGPEQRALSAATTTAGGYTVPTGFRDVLIRTTKAFGNVEALASTITTDSGNTLPWPTMDDTANVGAILAENTQVTQQDVAFGQAQLGAYMYTSKLVLVPIQLLQDSAFDPDSWLPGVLGERIARIRNQHYTTGTGTGQPEGVQTNAVIGKTGTTGQTTSVIYDDIVDLIHSVDPSYRNERARFMLHDTALAAIRKIKDTTGRPLWSPGGTGEGAGITGAAPASILGYGYTVNNDMPVMAANAKSILFGDFQAGYIVRNVLGVQTMRLEERYADFLQVGFLLFARSDAKPQQAAAIRAYRNSAT